MEMKQFLLPWRTLYTQVSEDMHITLDWFGLPNKRKGDHCSWQVGQHERILVSVNLIVTVLLCKAYIFFMNPCVQYCGAMDSMHGAAPNAIIPCSSVFHNIITMCILSLLMTIKSWLGLTSYFKFFLQRSIDKMLCWQFVRLLVASALQSPDPVSKTVVELQSLSMKDELWPHSKFSSRLMNRYL
jgi:hypothetical protein